jgi:DNA phosphorothioation-associated putative methyltransferase
MVMRESDTVGVHHKTAIRRGDYSRPVKCLLRDGLFENSVKFFDYGCGRAEDLELFASDGFACNGRGPTFRPDVVRSESDIVNLGFVKNVIENQIERVQTLNKVWSLCHQVLTVSAQVVFSAKSKSPAPFANDPQHPPEAFRTVRTEEVPRDGGSDNGHSDWNWHLLPVQG